MSLLLLLVGAILAGLLTRQHVPVQAGLVNPAAELASADISGFSRVTGPVELSFPFDHGPHPDYQTEWWYYTGNLTAESGQHFGYQLTFFRRALLPPESIPARGSTWAADQVYLAHFALSDISGRKYRAFERTARGAAGLAGAQSPPYQVWLEDWRVEQVDDRTYRLRAAQAGFAIDLTLVDQKGPVLHGERGYSQKGSEPGNASIYISQTRLITQGNLQLGSESVPVAGMSWMDHEFSTSALASDQIGWDWFSIQLDDGSELMAFWLRRSDGAPDPFSSGTFIKADGTTLSFSQDEIEIEVLDTWQSPHTGALYPSGWNISIPGIQLQLALTPYLPDQEITLRYTYWEGAVKINGEKAGLPLTGAGYVEMTGYAPTSGGIP